MAIEAHPEVEDGESEGQEDELLGPSNEIENYNCPKNVKTKKHLRICLYCNDVCMCLSIHSSKSVASVQVTRA